MGAGFSKGNNLWVTCERQQYVPGDLVRGVVCLNVTEAFETTGVDLTVEGREEVYWEETRSVSSGSGGNQTTHSETVRFRSHHDIFKMTVQVGPPGTMKPGQYQLPVAFTLPPGIPPSFNYTGSWSARCSIEYSMRAVCHRPGTFTRDIKCKQLFLVGALPWQRPPTPILQKEETVLTSCCCFSMGRAEMQVALPGQDWARGEGLEVVVDANNPSTARFKSLQLKIRQNVWMEGGDFGYKRSRADHDTVTEVAAAGLAPHSTLNKRRVVLPLPPGMLVTMLGVHFRVTFELEVVLKSRACLSDVKLRVPLNIIICRAQPTDGEQPQLLPSAVAQQVPLPPGAADWAPSKVLPPVALQVCPSAPPLPTEALEPDGDFWARVAGVAAEQAAKQQASNLPSNKPASTIPSNK